MNNLPTFDEMRNLAENNPEELERIKRRLIKNVIDSAPEDKRRRLEGLQFQIDLKIKASPNSFIAMTRIYDQMFDSFLVLDEKLKEFKDIQKKIENKVVKPKISHKLIIKNNNNKSDQ